MKNKDKNFLTDFKADWNRVCNAYVNYVNGANVPGFADFSAQKNDLAEKFALFYEVYLKYKFLPDVKFINNLDKPFWDTLAEMHDFLGSNPYPHDKNKLDLDRSYNIRYRGIILIDYMIILSNKKVRFYFLSFLRICVYLLPILGLILVIKNILNIWNFNLTSSPQSFPTPP